MGNEIKKTRNIVHYDGEQFQEMTDTIVTEFPLTIYVDGEEFATMLCTPSHLEELVVGFLASEGLIRRYEEIDTLQINEERGFAYVSLHVKKNISKDFYSKRFIGSCCGKSREFYFHNDVRTAKTIQSNMTISVSQCIERMAEMQKQSYDFQQTGGLHNAALCTAAEIVISRSDIGRHNALDKIYGHCLINKVPLRDKIIAFSGRISSEVLLKVSKIGVGIILSKSAPTELALDLAEDLGITAVGFIRNNRLNVYTHSYRISSVQPTNCELDIT